MGFSLDISDSCGGIYLSRINKIPGSLIMNTARKIYIVEYEIKDNLYI